ncbi:MoaD/ThiS family protein [Alkaliphilus peptidifermentans]|uniref:Molybdopterin converting factor, small subunit n=1 Tax=Alkaliphilus peptidifermentans DSM 18978 TaxID=1120976 RepID=A0A1G5FKV8_9FIRM|nr:MoaD/ThiS family protein [Alkaliphilus peptidifermentans]SCY39797.1 Molybdopterin converting factor, small subunit [Alkaliphilus peptidifermentans DSM 18978]
MIIEVRLFATLRENRQKVLQMDLIEGSTTEEVLSKLNIAPAEVAILLINGRDGLIDTPLKDNDVLSIFPPVGGG